MIGWRLFLIVVGCGRGAMEWGQMAVESGCFSVNVSLVTTRAKNMFSKLVFDDMTAGSGWFFQAGPIK